MSKREAAQHGDERVTSGGVADDACAHCTLASARRGDELEILEVGGEQARLQALRFGMAEGACVTCVTRIPAGPLVVRSGRQEIAVGRNLAQQIRVRHRGNSHAAAPVTGP